LGENQRKNLRRGKVWRPKAPYNCVGESPLLDPFGKKGALLLDPL